jgi:hypothetical protein
MHNRYRVVVEKQQPEVSHSPDYQIAVYGPNGLVGVVIKVLDQDVAVNLADNFKFAFEAGLREMLTQTRLALRGARNIAAPNTLMDMYE